MPAEIRVPALGESVVEATVGKWLKQVGDAVAQGDPLVSLETDKVDMEVAAEEAGVLARVDKNSGDTVAVGEVLGSLSGGGADHGRSGNGAQPQPAATATIPPAAVAAPSASATSSNPTPAPGIQATPVARRLATEERIDLAGLQGSGPGGRITKQDVSAARVAPAPSVSPVPITTMPTSPSPTDALAASRDGREERVRLSRRRQTIARRLVEAQHTAAMLTTFNEVDMTAIMEVRKRRRDGFKERHGVGLGFMSFFTKASIGALKAYPRLNAEIQGDEIVLKHYYDIGIAVGLDEGLVVPVVRDVDRKSFAQIEREIAALAGRARGNTLTLGDLEGGTFTITNGGVYGSLLSTPILNTPQVGILGMHKIEERPIAVGGQVVIRPMMYLALSYDHRIVDGSEAVRFLVRIKELLEDPEALLLEG
ncbi:MAG TPA: 2-oxoglutarate dehydrogenase complex dihydrolipoyllysine-residue succinyltransferase [Chloroflexota bacterium]|nr:2-oxoglutarate dehydrogenase complex dihydrolipoyllysine-residue succinyltransferase [Chloroflexota bacterium]